MANFKIFSLFYDIFFPNICVGCGKYGRTLCFDCAGQIERIKTAVCPACGKISVGGKYCPACKKRTNSELSGVIIAIHYSSGPSKEIIHNFKYNSVVELAEVLGELMVASLEKAEIPRDTIIVPVPLHPKKLGKRGYNQSLLIARYIAEKLDLRCIETLIRIKETETQIKLGRSARLANLANAFACKNPKIVRGKRILLVDDVITTGATLNECARVLKLAGAKSILASVAAKNI